ncbi:MAG: lamin tail domain-containing protein [Ginsengibacter sp.]
MKKIYPILFFLLYYATCANAQVVINEVYGGGGNNGSNYKYDFIELYNSGASDIALNGWSVQYASKAGTTWQVTKISGIIKAKGYYLIQEAKGNGGMVDLPSPDVTGTIPMSASDGKVLLSSSDVAYTSDCPKNETNVVDFVGYGAASCYEGSGPTVSPSASNSVQRSPEGIDNNDNKNNFVAGLPSPTNSGNATDIIPPVVDAYSPSNGATNIPTSFSAIITFNEAIKKGPSGNILLKLTADNSTVQTIDPASVTVSGASFSFPVSGISFNTSYYFMIDSSAIQDLAGNNFAGILNKTTWNFTTAATLPVGTIGKTYDLEQCVSSLPDGFTEFNVLGPVIWGCTTYGRDPLDSTKSDGNAAQISGYVNGNNQINQDWFLSPSFDLSGTTFPLLSFWSRTAFNGDPLQLKVSTDYPGTGDPSSYTWTDVNGKFPNQSSNVWALSNNIDLSAFKTSHTYFAFVYTSTIDGAARWTVDDIRVDNSTTAPPTSLTANADEVQFGYVPAQSAVVKDFTFIANDITTGVTVNVGGNFLVSKTNSNFSSSINYTREEADNISQKVFVQFLPTTNNVNYNDNVIISTAGVANNSIKVTGNSINSAITLEVVNWNLEWFGSTEAGLGPNDKDLQASNVKKVAVNVGADLYAFAEIVSEARLQSVVDTLNKTFGAGSYAYVLCDYGSHSNPFEPGAGLVANAQKEAFVYKTSVIANVSTAALVTNGVNTATDLKNPAYNYFSSGRYPYMMKADVTLGGVTKMVRFVLLHAKANTNPTNVAYERRKKGADTLNYTLNNLYPSDNIVLLGDFNDDLDFSITAGFTISSYQVFNVDSTHFYSPTLALSLAGKKSTVKYNDMIDHVELSNEMEEFYMKNTASVLTDVATLIPNYGTTTSDHYPVFTRYAFDPAILPVVLVSFTATKKNNAVVLDWSTSQEINSKEFVIEKSPDSKTWTDLSVINAKEKSANGNAYTITDYAPFNGLNYYRLKQIDQDGGIQFSLIRSVSFEAIKAFRIVPNPATGIVTLEFSKTNASITNVEVYDLAGKSIYQEATSNNQLKMNVGNFRKGTYIIKIKQGNTIDNQKLIVQ